MKGERTGRKTQASIRIVFGGLWPDRVAMSRRSCEVRYTTRVEVKDKKQVRFDAVVKDAGEPVQVTLWTKPEDDRDFMRAVKEKRVVTVIQHNVGTRKDYGLVGFQPQERATYLLFPKRIEQPEETKIVVIKYERLAMGEPKGRIYKLPKPKSPGIPLREKTKQQRKNEASASQAKEPQAKGPQAPPKRAEAPPPPRLFRFESRVELKATQTATVAVEAASAKEAAKLLKARAEEVTLDPAQAKVSRKVGRPVKG